MPIPDEWDLSGKVAIVTGDHRGWTPYLASALAEAGADVGAAGAPGSDAAEAAEAVARHGRRSIFVETDLTSRADVDAMVRRVVGELGKVDILVNNARIELGKPFLDTTEGEWDAVMDLNVRGMFLCCQAVGAQMLDTGGGRIVNIGTGLAARGLWNSAAACASQGAVRQLTAALGLEWSRRNIRVNAIGAGWLATGPPEELEHDSLARYIPSRRRGHPSDLCGLLVYMASDACDFMTGQMVFIDGGAMAHA